MSGTALLQYPKRRAPLHRQLTVFLSVLLMASVFLSFQGTPQSTQIQSESHIGDFLSKSQSVVAPVRQENDLRSHSIRTVPSTSVQQRKTNFVAKAPSTPQEKLGNNLQSFSTTQTQEDAAFAACLLIKDDNYILNEWIAYHYHTLNLRHLIVAMDPFSKTSPSELLNQWRQPPFGIHILEWNDADYMPDYFLRGFYDQVPSFLPPQVQQDPKTSIWHRHDKNPSNMTDIQADLIHINNHRFRQATFVSQCFRKFRQDNHKWVIHIDTDEYVVINPRLRARPRAVTGVNLPSVPYPGSLVDFLLDMYRQYPKRLLPSCLMMPTILFGATDNITLPTIPGWNRSRFETMRWTYHATLKDSINGLQKAIIDVSTLPKDHPIFVNRLIKSVHQPLESTYSHWKNGTFPQICRHMTLTPDVDAVRLFPLTIHHYVGSLERYMARQDIRRNLDIYQQKAQVQGGVDDGWIQGWLLNFVQTYGVQATRRVLEDYTDAD